MVGGDGSQSTALLLAEIGLPVVGVPKTIDNDLGATDVTFGFNSAVAIVSDPWTVWKPPPTRTSA